KRMPNSVNKASAPAKKEVNSQRPFLRKTFHTERAYFLSGGGCVSFSGSWIKKMTARMEIRQNTGKAKKTAYQTISASSEPMIGLSTLPVPFEASVNPSALLSVAPLYISPTRAMAIGA